MLLIPTFLSLLAITSTIVALNPQSLPPAHHMNHDNTHDLNPQPLPPGRRIPIHERDSCAPSYVKCAPPGATGTSIPVIGSSVKDLYLNVLESVQSHKLDNVKRQGFPNFRRPGYDVSHIQLDVSVNVDPGKMIMMENLKRKSEVDVTVNPVQCSDNSFGGLIVIGCTPVNINLEKRSTIETAEMVKRPAGIDVGVNLHVPADDDPILEEFELRKRATTVQMCCAAGTQCLLLKDFDVPFCWDKFTTNFFLPFSSYGSLTTGNYTSPAPRNAPPNTPSNVNLLSGNYTRPDGSSGNIYSDDEAAKPDTVTLGSLMPTPWTSTGVGSAIPASALGGIATWTTVIDGTTVEPSVVGGSTLLGTTVAPVTTAVTGFEETATSTGASSTRSKGGAASGGRGAEEWATGMAVAIAGMLFAVLGL